MMEVLAVVAVSSGPLRPLMCGSIPPQPALSPASPPATVARKRSRSPPAAATVARKRRRSPACAAEAVERDATFSKDGLYRYRLGRTWGECGGSSGSGALLVIGLNPSTADGERDDPTIRRCIDFARRWGHTSLVITNLFAHRATNPRALMDVDDPVGPKNDQWLIEEAKRATQVLCAWGNGGKLLQRDKAVLSLLASAGLDVACGGGGVG